MTTMTKINSDSEPDLDLDAIKSEMAELRRTLATLTHKAKVEASDEIANARASIEHFGDRASQAYKNLAKQGKRSAKAIGRYVEGKPAISLLLAFAVGFVGGRILLR